MSPSPSLPAVGSLPISCVVITRDAGDRLGATLDSAQSCAERLVLDSGSTDATVSIAQKRGARVEHQPFLGFGLQKRRAVELATHDWILSLDADEALDDEAISGLAALDLSDPARCWAWRRRTFIGSREMRHGPWGRERVLRLFNRTACGFTDHRVHERVVGATAPLQAPGSILHHSFNRCADVIVRSARYSGPKAAILRDKGETSPAWTLPLRGLAAFTKSYCLQGGWRDGAAGFIVALSRVVDSTLPRAIVNVDPPPAPSPPADRPGAPSPR
jgi:glycosyltransferase involved in cell wall biosynthesis